MKAVTLPQLPWHGTKELKLPVPDNWEVKFYRMTGWDRPAMRPAAIREAVNHPIGCSPIRELAKGKQEVVIIFDDMTRVTRAADIVPFVLQELAEAGIPDRRIRFVCALGCHGAHTRIDFVKKLGEEVLRRFPVYNHNPFDECTYVGTTDTCGTELFLNSEVMSCDFKIAIGLVVPHPATGFAGGGKIILPGVASIKAVEHNHRAALECARSNREKPVIGMGVFDANPIRRDIEEAATLAGLDVLINCIVNERGETVALFTGGLVPCYADAVKEAKIHYHTADTQGEDIIIANTFTKANEAIAIGLYTAFSATGCQRCEVILIANAPDGQVTHYLMGPFGSKSSRELTFKATVPQHVQSVSIYSEYPELTGRDYIEESDKVFFMNDWDDVVSKFEDRAGADIRVAVFPAADIQYSRSH